MRLTHQLRLPAGAELLPDKPPYHLRIRFHSESSGKQYTVSLLCGPESNYFVCSCPGAVNRGDCKHLREIGLWGRASKNRSQALARDLGLLDVRPTHEDITRLAAEVLMGQIEQADAGRIAELRRGIAAPVELLQHLERSRR